MRGKLYFKRLISALLNQKHESPVNITGLQALYDSVLLECGKKQEKVRAHLDLLIAAEETALRRELTEQINSSTAERLKAVYRRALDNPLQTILEQGSSEPIPVVFICDDAYAIPTGVAITSLLCNKNKQTRYAVIILGKTLSEANTRMLTGISPAVTVMPCEGTKRTVYAKTHSYVSDAALLKFDIPQVLLQYDKVLYLDSDVLVLDDLSNLYATALMDNYAAVVKDLLGAHYNFHKRTGLSSYFNSGVLLLNTRKMRGDNISVQLDMNKAKDKWKMLMDQDTFNVTFAENVVWLHPRYNLMYANNLSSGWSLSEMASFYGISTQDMQETMLHPVIDHLSSQTKPWNTPLAEKYLDYQEYRVLFDLLLEKQGFLAERKR